MEPTVALKRALDDWLAAARAELLVVRRDELRVGGGRGERRLTT